jgi:hypothetical protein
MIFKLDVARSNLYSATVKIDDSPITVSEGNEGFSRYIAKLEEGYHHVDVRLSTIVQKKGDGLFTSGLNLALFSTSSILEDSKAVKFSYDIKIDEKNDILYLDNNGNPVKALTSAEVLHTSSEDEYDYKDFKELIRFSAFFLAPLILFASLACLAYAILFPSILGEKFMLLKQILVGCAGGGFFVLSISLIVKVIKLNKMLKKHKSREDKYDKL